MPLWTCEQCGAQFPDSAVPPVACPVCEDERQYVNWKGQDWLTRVGTEAKDDLVGGRLTVDEYLTVQGHPELIACGDIAAVPDPARPGELCAMTALFWSGAGAVFPIRILFGGGLLTGRE